jgi:hypothetical protein
MSENFLLLNRNILIVINEDKNEKLEYIINNFCGIIIKSFDFDNFVDNQVVYLCGDINEYFMNFEFLDNIIINVIEDFSYNFSNIFKYNLISVEQVPINIENFGLYIKNFFDTSKNFFDLINQEHIFQDLTESNKPSNAFRKGIYLSNIEKNEFDEIKFNLLRCSTNLDGPTDNFRDIDKYIIEKVNNISKYFFNEEVKFNHVLAQIYYNLLENNKEKKAKIKSHSDKTKDMPKNGLIAFCTFYKDVDNFTNLKNKKEDAIFTKLRFRSKTSEFKNFEVILYPNSVFIIPLLTNRLFTHEIVPSLLPINMIPIRLGYVLRCSKTNAIYKDDQTYIIKDNKYIKLQYPTYENITELKNFYYKENLTTENIIYPDFDFSMNRGDNKKPII